MQRLFETIPKKSTTQIQQEKSERVRFTRPCSRCGKSHKTTKYGLVCEDCKGKTAEKKFAKRKN